MLVMLKILMMTVFSYHQYCDVDTGDENALDYAQAFLMGVKKGESTDKLVYKLQHQDLDKLVDLLDTDAKKKAFWINIYNAYVQKKLKENPEKYQKRSKFFKDDFIVVAGERMSLDDIEHGILRRSSVKLSWGYFKDVFPGKLEKRLRVDELDYRIHFALNCGASSCPPIAFYNHEHIEQQLEMAQANFMQSGVKIKDDVIYASQIFGWFRGDFGGKKSIKELIIKERKLDPEKKYKLKFMEYDWSMELDRYSID